MSDVKIHKIAAMKMKKPLVVLGFPGTGLVGSVAASQIIEALEMEFGGYISSPEFAPLAAIHDYVPFPAARIHFSKKHNIIVILSEMSIPNSATLDLAEKLFEFAKGMSASAIISLGGISAKEGKNDVYIISSDRKALQDLVKMKAAKPIKEGATTGVTGILLAKGTLNHYPVTTLLAEAAEDYVDPQAASNAIKVLSKMIGKKISTTMLDQEAVEKTKGLKEGMVQSKIPRRAAPGDEGGSMYG
ncbi:MAG: PAC2 family protein [Candidatus Micrarchaeota archaeon]